MENENKEITSFQEANAEVQRRQISADVYNALNLYDEKLGEEYEKEGYNPFSPDFKLTQEFAEEVLEHKYNKQSLPKEDFLEVGAKKVTSYFKNTLTTGELLAQKLEGTINNSSFDMSVVHQINQAIIFLKNRNQLLKRNIRELKYRNSNTIQMFADMYAMDKELSELLKESYTNDVDVDAILQQFMQICQQRAKEVVKKREQIAKEQKKKQDLYDEMGKSLHRSGTEMFSDIVELVDKAVDIVENITGLDLDHDHHHHHEHHHEPNQECEICDDEREL